MTKITNHIGRLAQDVTFSSRRKEMLKSRLISRIERDRCHEEEALLYRLGQAIYALASYVSIPALMKQHMRRRVVSFASLDLGTFSLWDMVWGRGMRFAGRFALAGVMVFLITFASIFGFPPATQVAFASESVLRDVEGDVYVYRSGMLLPVEEGFVLKEGDRIHTGYGASATALFADDTVSRIAGESKLNIYKLYANPENPEETMIMIGVAQGRMWSKVMGLTKSVFNVATLYALVETDHSATFDVRATEENSTEISVMENFVDVELSSYSPAVKTTVVEGESLVLKDGKSKIVALDTKDEWVRLNLSKDEFETQLLAQEDAENLEGDTGALPDDPLYSMKTFKEDLGVVLSMGEREKLAEELRIASNRLNEAELLINKGLRGSAEKVLVEYKERMLGLIEEYPELLGIASAKEELDAIIARDRRRFNTTLPGSSLYDIKEVVEEVELLLANDRVRANQIAFAQASDNLYQVFELVRLGGEVVALPSLEEYRNAFDRAFSDLSLYEQADRAAYLDEAFEIALNDVKILSALEEVVDVEVLNVGELKDYIVSKLETYVAQENTEEQYAYVLMEMDILLAPNLLRLVQQSEFTGINSGNAATVDVSVLP